MNITPPNPNAIIAALLDIASAAHQVIERMSADHMSELNVKLALLDTLPQLAPNENFPGPRRARGWLASFLVGEVALNFPPEQLKQLQTALNQARSEPLLVAEFEKSMREYQDAELLDSLRMMCGYVENGTSESVTIAQDDATRDWTLRIGTDIPGLRIKARRYHSTSFHQVIRVAAEKEIPDEEPTMCEFCGMSFESPCEAPPTGPCEQANNAFHGSDPTKPRVHLDVRPMDVQLDQVRQKIHEIAAPMKAAATDLRLKRDHMNARLIEVKEAKGVTAAKLIIKNVGADRMSMIPDDKMDAVLRACHTALTGETEYFVHYNGGAWMVKEGDFFRSQEDGDWKKAWHAIMATSIEDARERAAAGAAK